MRPLRASVVVQESVERVILSIEVDDEFRNASGKGCAACKLLSVFSNRGDFREASREPLAKSRDNGQGNSEGLECAMCRTTKLQGPARGPFS